jgi:hypothetical protein
MPDVPASGRTRPRWEYQITWLYGPLILVVVGLALLGFGASGVSGTSISVAMLPIGLACLLAGVALPRIEGSFTAGPQGITAQMRPVDAIETFTVTGRAVTLMDNLVIEGDKARVIVDTSPEDVAGTRIPTLGDVWDALDQAGIVPTTVGLGHAHLEMPDSRTMSLPNRGFLDWRPASEDLLMILRTWGVQATVSGKYPVPPDLPPDNATEPIFPHMSVHR